MDLKQVREAADLAGEFANLLFNIETKRKVEELAKGGGVKGAGPRVPTAAERAEKRKKAFTEALIRAKEKGIDVSKIERFLDEHQEFISMFTPEEVEFALGYPIPDKEDVDIDKMAELLGKMNEMAKDDPNFLIRLTQFANDRAVINRIFSVLAKGWHHLNLGDKTEALKKALDFARETDAKIATELDGIRDGVATRRRYAQERAQRTLWKRTFGRLRIFQ